jgi:hypothetical protein
MEDRRTASPKRGHRGFKTTYILRQETPRLPSLFDMQFLSTVA